MKSLQNKSVCQTVIAPVTLRRPKAAAAAVIEEEEAASRSGYIVCPYTWQALNNWQWLH